MNMMIENLTMKINALALSAGDDETGTVRLGFHLMNATKNVVEMYIDNPSFIAYAACVMKYFNTNMFALGTIARLSFGLTLDTINKKLPQATFEVIQSFLQTVSVPRFVIGLLLYCVTDMVYRANKTTDITMQVVPPAEQRKINSFIQQVQSTVVACSHDRKILEKTLLVLQKTYAKQKFSHDVNKGIKVTNYLFALCMIKDFIIRNVQALGTAMKAEKKNFLQVAGDYTKWVLTGDIVIDATMPYLVRMAPFIILAASIQANMILFTPDEYRGSVRHALNVLAVAVLCKAPVLSELDSADTSCIATIMLGPSYVAERIVDSRTRQSSSEEVTNLKLQILMFSTALSFVSFMLSYSHKLDGTSLILSLMASVALHNLPCVLMTGIENMSNVIQESIKNTDAGNERGRISQIKPNLPQIESELTNLQMFALKLTREHGRENVKKACHLLTNHAAAKNASWLCHEHVQHVYKVL